MQRRRQRAPWAARVVALRLWCLTTLLGLAACRQDEPRAHPVIGNMGNESYWSDGEIPYKNGLGKSVRLDQFEGYFVWLDCSAPWCGPCQRQAPVLRKLERPFAEDVVFLTLLTSDYEPNVVATAGTARTWADHYKLDPAAVLASRSQCGVVPQHTLFSPFGQTLYHQVGYHTEAQIRATLAAKMAAWNRWYEHDYRP